MQLANAAKLRNDLTKCIRFLVYQKTMHFVNVDFVECGPAEPDPLGCV